MTARPHIADRFDRWIFTSWQVSAPQLGIFRIFFALFNLVFLFQFDFTWPSAYHEHFYAAAPGIGSLFGGFPPAWLLWTGQALLMLSALGMLFGCYTRLASVLHTLLLLFLFNFVFAFGNIYHIILWVLLPAVMSLSNWGAALSLDARAERSSAAVQTWPITLMAVLIGFAFFTSGLAKLTGGWLSVEASAVEQYFFNTILGVGRDGLLSDWVMTWNAPLLWEMLDWMTVLFECGFLLAVFSRRWFRWFCFFGLCFHIGILLILDISFSIHVAVFALFIPWEKMGTQTAHISNFLQQYLFSRPPALHIGLAAAYFGAYLLVRTLWPAGYLVDGGTWIDTGAFLLASGYCGYWWLKIRPGS